MNQRASVFSQWHSPEGLCTTHVHQEDLSTATHLAVTPEEEISREGKGTGSREAATIVLSGRLEGLISNAAERRLGTILRKAIGLRGTHTLRRVI